MNASLAFVFLMGSVDYLVGLVILNFGYSIVLCNISINSFFLFYVFNLFALDGWGVGVYLFQYLNSLMVDNYLVCHDNVSY